MQSSNRDSDARKVAPKAQNHHRESEPDDGWIFRQHAAFCSIFSDEKRLRIMWFLRDGEKRVSEIAEHLGVTAQNTSQHLRLMRSKGALSCRREGQAAYYRIANEKFVRGAQLVREGVLEELRRKGRKADAKP